MTVTKKEIANKVWSALGKEINQADVLAVVQKTIETISETLRNGDSITLRNFGSFEVKRVKQKVGRNPKNPEKDVVIPARSVVKFKVGKELKAAVAKLEA